LFDLPTPASPSQHSRPPLLSSTLTWVELSAAAALIFWWLVSRVPPVNSEHAESQGTGCPSQSRNQPGSPLLFFLTPTYRDRPVRRRFFNFPADPDPDFRVSVSRSDALLEEVPMVSFPPSRMHSPPLSGNLLIFSWQWRTPDPGILDTLLVHAFPDFSLAFPARILFPSRAYPAAARRLFSPCRQR